ncbi:hypothetical protein J8I87_40690 [Paraburkholderia sp. LEh10]|jgi:hypothetical protein|uniref:hypothetical protein n=1 Tax=Paraburkholderia sp. LEh10 TaxID=2821353 RepID=UPI001AE1D76F|nr:hypothetical protein [Paraburkholderia sp. LEh10]MBP0595839.1 hypothetical protein [Paraburkholderia sp. LEh10]
MNAFHATVATSTGIIAIVFLVLVTVCGTGIAAFAGLLPASERVAATVTIAPLVDIQTDRPASPARSVD